MLTYDVPHISGSPPVLFSMHLLILVGLFKIMQKLSGDVQPLLSRSFPSLFGNVKVIMGDAGWWAFIHVFEQIGQWLMGQEDICSNYLLTKPQYDKIIKYSTFIREFPCFLNYR